MCNKCEVASTPSTPLLNVWGTYKRENLNDYKVYAYMARGFMMRNHQNENQAYWGHSYHSWPEQHKDNQDRGHDIAKQKAIADKYASRDTNTVQDYVGIQAYFTTLERNSMWLIEKLEPNYVSAMRAPQNQGWEMIDMYDLHPANNGGVVADKILADGAVMSADNQYLFTSHRFGLLNMLHRLHISKEDNTQIAYYPTLKHMRDGREIRTRLGRYLTKYQDILGLTESVIKSISEKHTSNMQARNGWAVQFVAHDDPQGWVNIYDDDTVSSCMQGERAVRVYAHEKSVLRLAYVKVGEKVIARCIVRDDDDNNATGYLRVYPDSNGYAEGRYLLDYLITNGYPNKTNLNGVLLQHIETHKGIVCPYLDYGNNGDQSVSIDYIDGSNYLVVGGGDYRTDNTIGYIENDNCHCDDCNDSVHQEDTRYIEYSERTVCQSCADNDYTYARGRHGHEYYPNNVCVEVEGDWYYKDTIDYHDIGYCEHSNEYYRMENLQCTTDGTFHQDYCIAVDHYTDYVYVYERNVATLSDGTTCHENDEDHYQAEIDVAEAEALEEQEEEVA